MAEKEANTNYGFSDIHRYLNGQMTAKEMHDIERAALQDPFLADAIEGYENRDKQQSEKHLNEITAAVQGNHKRAKIIAPFKRRRYGWIAAASVLFLLCISMFILYQNKSINKPATLASNDVKKNEIKDSFSKENKKLSAPNKDSAGTVMQDAIASAKPKEETYTTSISKKKEPKQKAIAFASPSKKDSMLLAAVPAAALSYRSKTMSVQSSLPATNDTFHNDSIDQSIAKGFTTRAFAASPKVWTTDKNKPFILSEVKVITINKKTKKATDTSSIKPEGGWLLFQDYLFGKLNKKDSSAVVNQWSNNSDIELEFSVSETGLPYDVQALHAPDSTMASKAVAAIKQGPKWLNTDKKEKRLNLKFNPNRLPI